MTDSTAARWREAYQNALFSLEDGETLAKIDAAENAIAARGRELFELRGDIVEEIHALDAARYALRALRGCVALRTEPPAPMTLAQGLDQD